MPFKEEEIRKVKIPPRSGGTYATMHKNTTEYTNGEKRTEFYISIPASDPYENVSIYGTEEQCNQLLNLLKEMEI